MHDRCRVLVVEDEVAVAEPLLYVLKIEGFQSNHVILGREALAAHSEHPYDLVVLDLGLPDMPGFDVLREIRSAATGPDVPVMFLTARGDEIDRVLGLELGADDYVTKPFSPREVVVRIRAILRRGQVGAVRAVQTNSVWLRQPESLRIQYCGISLELTRNEYRLLDLMLSHPGRIFMRDDIMARVWCDALDSSDRTIDAHIKTLRAKLKSVRAEIDPIKTHRNLGYSLEPE